MSKVRFAGSTEIHEMRCKTMGSNLICVYPPFPVEDVTAGFFIVTEKGKVFGDYTAFTTIYREMDDGSVILSNDGSVWTPPPEPEPVPDPEPYVPTLEEVKAQKKQEVGAACEQTIFAGVNVQLTDGTIEHFSLAEKDQLNLFGKQAQLAEGLEQLEYHQDGHPCRYYSAEDMRMIIAEAMKWVSYHTTYCNSLNMWIAGAEIAEEVNKIYYGADIPEEYQSEVLKDYLAEIMAEASNETGV